MASEIWPDTGLSGFGQCVSERLLLRAATKMEAAECDIRDACYAPKAAGSDVVEWEFKRQKNAELQSGRHRFSDLGKISLAANSCGA